MPRTNTDKKRLVWTLIAIAFFFANLTLLGIMIINSLSAPKPPATPPATTATTTSRPTGS